MPSAERRALIAVGAIAAIVIAFVVLKPAGGGDQSSKDAASTATIEQTTTTATSSGATGTPPTSTATTPSGGTAAQPAASRIRIVGGQPQGGVAKLSFRKGDPVRFTVVSDTADEIHVHGYDLHKDIAKGGTAAFSFPGTIDGRFEVELVGASVQIAQLDVTP